ncbi:MAG: hypothetical protein HQL64_10985 [Magnetococcales bacterium]|nr:hypothetical protein [Magnetococcales bacterium]
MWVMLGFLLLFVGCSSAEAPEVDPHIYTQDTILDTLQRFFMPRAYWTKRIEQLRRSVNEAHAVFQERHAAYRQILATRRQIALAEKGNPDPQHKPRYASTSAWNEAIRSTRTDLERLRQESRDASRQLKQRTLWLKQAELTLNHASW